MQSLSFEPLISPALWWAIAALGVAVLVAYALRRPAITTRRKWAAILALMSCGLLIPLLILANPLWIERLPPPVGKPRLTVLVDRSASMATADAEGSRTRFQAAAAVAKACVSELQPHFDVYVRTFADRASPVEVEALATRPPDGRQTDLAEAITDSLEKESNAGQAILLLSDGIHNAGGGTKSVFAAARLARAAGTPVYTRAFGRESAISDIALRVQTPQQMTFVGQKVQVSSLIKRYGAVPRKATVAIQQGGVDLERKEVVLSRDDETEVRFSVMQPKKGLYRYQARVEPVPGEVTSINNFASFVLRVIDEPIHVLLLEGKPYWDAKFLMRTLAADPSIELDCVVKLAKDRLLRRSLTHSQSAAPAVIEMHEKLAVVKDSAIVLAEPNQLRRYQVIVLGRGAEVFLTEAALVNLRTWISRESGSLVCYRGQPMAKIDQHLDRILPVRWDPAAETRFRMKLTERGRLLNWLDEQSDVPGQGLTRLPSLASASTASRLKPLATIVATAASRTAETEQPVVTYHPYGAGRVVVIEGSGMWRWAFLPPRYKDHEVVYRGLWQSLIRWLISSVGLLPGQQYALQADKVTFNTLEPAAATLLMRDDDKVPRIELTGGALKSPRFVQPVAVGEEPGSFRVLFGSLPEGRYEARIAGQPAAALSDKTAFDVTQFIDEQLDLMARPELMARIAAATGGAALSGVDSNEITEQFKRHLAVNRPEQVIRHTAWDRWWVLTGVVFLWAGSWGVRRFAGLI